METLEVIELECVESKDFDSTNLIITNLVNLLRQDFEYRNNFIEASIFNKKVKLSINNLLVALILIKIKYMLSKSLSIKDLIVIEGNTDIASKINKYINAVIEEYDNHHIQEVNALVADTLEQIADITYSINSFNGSTVNLYDLCKLANESSDVKDMLSYQVDENKQYYDIESDVGAVTTKFINRLKEDKSNCYNYILSSVSRKQFSQAFINVSLKPDLYGNVIPRAVNSSFLRGLRDPIDYFITSIGARKALITNATFVKSAGYLSRKMSLLVINLSKSDVNDCKSKDYIIFNIENEEMLKRLHNRFYYDKQSDKLLLINKHRKELIGTTVHLRSPITCHLDGVHMCKTCLGTMPDNNHFHVALSGVLVLTEQITQILNLMGSLNFFNCWKLLKL